MFLLRLILITLALLIISCKEEAPPEDIWKQALAYDIETANRILITKVDRDTFPSEPESITRVILDVEKHDIGKEFLDRLSFDTEMSGNSCMCISETYANFYCGKELLAKIEIIPSNVFIYDGWVGDGVLTEESIGSINEWFLDLGSDFYKDQIEIDNLRELDRKDRYDSFFSYFPPNVRDNWMHDYSKDPWWFFNTYEKEFNKQFRTVFTHYENPSDAIFDVCLALGGINEPWGNSPIQIFVELSITGKGIDDEWWIKALKKIEGSIQAKQGFSYLFFIRDFRTGIHKEDETKWFIDLASTCLTHSKFRYLDIGGIIWKMKDHFNDDICSFLLAALSGQGITEVNYSTMRKRENGIKAQIALMLSEKGVQEAKPIILSLLRESSWEADINTYKECLSLLEENQ